MTTRTAEIAILGAGVMGASLAWHLVSRGCRDVLLLDRHPAPGGGSTGRATGGFRAQFATEVNVRLSLLSREKLRRFPEELGADPGYRPCGYLFLAGDEEQLAVLRSLQPLQRRLGLDEVREVTPEEARRINPAVEIDGIPGGSFCPTDGFIRPLAILDGYLEAARRLGARVSFGETVTGLETREGRIARVLTDQGAVAARQVVNAAGAWAAPVARLAGVEVPVRPERRQVALTEPFGALPEDMPLTIFLENGFHLRVRDGRVLLLHPVEEPHPNPFDATFDERWLDGVVARAHAHVPCLANARIDRAGCWAGLYETSPDKHALLGLAPGFENFWLIDGSSGHGVMHSPALGQLLAEMILDGRAQTMDVHPLRPSRFLEGEPNSEVSLL
jgi:sarcosine oxidase, subunit beta